MSFKLRTILPGRCDNKTLTGNTLIELNSSTGFSGTITGATGATGATGSSGQSTGPVDAIYIGTNAQGNIIDTSTRTFTLTNVSILSIGFDIIPVFGQSNSVGYGTGIDTILDYTNDRILQLGQLSGYNNTLIKASEPLQHAENTIGLNRIGFALAFSREMLKILPINRTIILVPCGVGGTGFSGNRWNPGNDLYNTTITRVQTALALGTPTNNRILCYLWHQGEADTGSGGTGSAMTQNDYATALDNMINSMRTTLGLAPFLAGDFVQTWASGVPASTPIRAAINDLINRIDYTGVANTDSLGGDGTTGVIHFSAASQRILGVRYYTAYSSALTNVPPTTIPSQVSGLTSSSQTTTTISLSWNAINRIINYNIYYKLTSDSVFTLLTTSTTNSKTITGLTASTSYDFKVSAVNVIGEGPQSSVYTISTSSSTPAPTPVWEINFSSGSPVNVGSDTNVVPTIVNTGGTVITIENDATRGNVMKRTITTDSASRITLSNSGLPVNYTKAVWFKAITVGTYFQNLITNDTTGTGGRHFLFVHNNSSFFTAGNSSDLNIDNSITTDPSPHSANVWYHVAATYDNTTKIVKLYRNGVMVNSTDISAHNGSWNGGKDCNIGTFEQAAGLHGYVDKPQVYNSVLTDQQILDIYTNELL